jgi:hypothetical protein
VPEQQISTAICFFKVFYLAEGIGFSYSCFNKTGKYSKMIYDSLAELVRLARQKAQTDNVVFSRDHLFRFLKEHKQVAEIQMHYVKSGTLRLKLRTTEKLTAYLDLTILETGVVDKVDYLVSPHVESH